MLAYSDAFKKSFDALSATKTGVASCVWRQEKNFVLFDVQRVCGFSKEEINSFPLELGAMVATSLE